ncbi:MAG: MarR family transcriptional regulator [Acidimicrobiia bacterium]|nr:MarR family transcriptional regulator [Acidimicrobiia bacterium]
MGNSKLLADNRITEFGLLIEATRRLTRVIETSLRDNHDLGLVEFEAMVRLGRSPERQMSMSDLAGQMVLTSGGVTRLVDRLAAAGLVERVSCPSDRRVHWAKLTDDGVTKVSVALETHLADLDDHFFSEMSESERAVTVPVLERLRTACSER